MSKLHVNEIVEASAGHGIHIPGHVVQVVVAEGGGPGSGILTNSTSWLTVVSASITPTSPTSKIYVHCSNPVYGGNENKLRGHCRLSRETTTIQAQDYFWYREYNGAMKATSGSIVKLDTPNTTNEITYQAQAKTDGGENNLHLNLNGAWTLTLMEIAQ